jgi:uncharacterized repeat protein (TIGR01451 family)
MVRIAVILVLALGAASVVAQGVAPPANGSLELKTVVEKVVESIDENGKVVTALVPVDLAVPGDQVVYTMTFKNVGERGADDILITNPIPAALRYVDGTAFGPGTAIVYSADGGHNYGRPDEVLVPDSDGELHAATAEDYTHIRWMLTSTLDAGAQGFARFRAVVR